MEEKKKDRVGKKKQQLIMSSVLWPIWKNKMNLACLNIWFDVCFPFWLSFMCFVSNLCPIYILCIDELCQLFEIVKLLIIETEAQQQREREWEYCELIEIGTLYKNHCFHTIFGLKIPSLLKRDSIQVKITFIHPKIMTINLSKLLNQWHIWNMCVYDYRLGNVACSLASATIHTQAIQKN